MRRAADLEIVVIGAAARDDLGGAGEVDFDLADELEGARVKREAGDGIDRHATREGGEADLGDRRFPLCRLGLDQNRAA